MPPAQDAEALDRVRQLLEAQPGIRFAFAFGSVPAGRAGFESDIDVAVLAEEPLDVERYMELIRAIALATRRPVDLIDLTDCRSSHRSASTLAWHLAYCS